MPISNLLKGTPRQVPLALVFALSAPTTACKKTVTAQVQVPRQLPESDKPEKASNTTQSSSDSGTPQNPDGVSASKVNTSWGEPGFATQTPSTSLPPVELRGLPPATASISHLAVQVLGQSHEAYRFALISGTQGCKNTTYSEWRPLNRPIDSPVSLSGKVKLCVVGRSATALQQDPTEYNWVQVQSAEPFVRLSNVPNDGHTGNKINVYVDGLGISQYHSILLEGRTSCPQVPSSLSGLALKPVYAHIDDSIQTEGPKKICVLGVTSTGQKASRYVEHSWHQGAKPTEQKSDPKPQQVRIDLTNVNFEAWHKICLYVSANNGPFRKMGCNKQDSEKMKDFIDFDFLQDKCVTLNFRLEVFGYLESCANLDDVSSCPVSSIADPVRMTSNAEDLEFFSVMPLKDISLARLEAAHIDTSVYNQDQIDAVKKEAEEWLSKGGSRSWIRLFMEDQSDQQMQAFKNSQDSISTGIDFDDFVVDIRSIDVGFSLPQLGISCAHSADQ